MNRLEISVIDPSAALDGFAHAWHQAELVHPQPSKLAFGSRGSDLAAPHRP